MHLLRLPLRRNLAIASQMLINATATEEGKLQCLVSFFFFGSAYRPQSAEIWNKRLIWAWRLNVWARCCHRMARGRNCSGSVQRREMRCNANVAHTHRLDAILRLIYHKYTDKHLCICIENVFLTEMQH